MTSIQLEETKNDIANNVIKMLNEIGVNKDEDGDLTNIWKRSPSYTNSYDEEWSRLFNFEYVSIQNLRSLGLLGELRNCRFRSVCWRVYLGIFGENIDSWKKEVQTERSIYVNLRNEYIIDPHNKSSPTANVKDDPLSLKLESQWNKYFRSQDLIKEIKQDVVRTFPEIEFFHSASVRTSMINVLYCYSQTSKLSYRQGMHEILAPLVFVLHCDQTAYEHSCELSRLSQSTNEVCSVLLDSDWLEHDAYSMFARLMHFVEPWYDSSVRNINKPVATTTAMKSRPSFPEQRPFSRHREVHLVPDCSVGHRLASIHENILRRHDLDLFLQLERLDIAPQMFGLRWLKLLFGREFTLQDLLVVWDVVFAAGNEGHGGNDTALSLVDHVYVAMLIQIRDCLLAAPDFAGCLTLLMRYPSNVDVNRIVDLALHLYRPDRYERPPDQPLPRLQLVSTTASGGRRRRSHQQRNKTIVGIEGLASRFGNFIGTNSKKGTNELMADSAPSTPINRPASRERNGGGEQGDGGALAVRQGEKRAVIRACVSMVDEALAAIGVQDLGEASARLCEAREALTATLGAAQEGDGAAAQMCRSASSCEVRMVDRAAGGGGGEVGEARGGAMMRELRVFNAKK